MMSIRLLIIVLMAGLFACFASITGVYASENPLSNPGFEQNTKREDGSLFPKDWQFYRWDLPANVIPSSGVTADEHAEQEHALFIQTFEQKGAAGWISRKVAVPAQASKIQLTFQIKASSDFDGGVPWAFIGCYQGNAYKGKTDVKIPALNSGNWQEAALSVDVGELPAGTDMFNVTLAMIRPGQSTKSARGNLYYDHVRVEFSQDSAPRQLSFALKSNAPFQWWKPGESVVFKSERELPASVEKIRGTVFDSSGNTVDDIMVDKTTFSESGWTWPAKKGFYEIVFRAVMSDRSERDIISSYAMQSPRKNKQTFIVSRYAVAVTDSASPIRNRPPQIGFSYTPGTPEILQMADRVGMSFVRIHAIPWGAQFTNESAAIEPERGQYRWEKLDSEMQRIRELGYPVIANILYTPKWASPFPEDTHVNICVRGYSSYAPKDVNDFAAFVGLVMDRYGDMIGKWELWNEPNMPGGSVFWKDTPENFVALMKAGYQAVKKKNPDAQVLIGGLGGKNYYTFYDRYLKLGGGAYMDQLALHGANVSRSDFARIEKRNNAPSRSWVNTEWHAFLINASSGTMPSEFDLSKRMLLDMFSQIKQGAESLALFSVDNLVDREVIPFAHAEGWFVHSSGLFRTRPRREPRLPGVVMHNVLSQIQGRLTYRGEYSWDDGQKCVWFNDDSGPLLFVWNDAPSASRINGQLAGLFNSASTMVDWEGRDHTEALVGNRLICQSGTVYIARGIQTAVLSSLPIADNVVDTAGKRARQIRPVPAAKMQATPLFADVSEPLNAGIQWIEKDWSFRGIGAKIAPVDFSARYAMYCGAKDLDIAVEVRDTALVQKEAPAGKLWDGDSVQFGILTDDSELWGSQVELIAAETSQGPVIRKTAVPYSVAGNLPQQWTPVAQALKHGRVVVERRNDITLYKIRVAWSELYPLYYSAGETLRFSLLVNNNNGDGRIGFLEWAGGIGGDKEPAYYGKITP